MQNTGILPYPADHRTAGRYRSYHDRTRSGARPQAREGKSEPYPQFFFSALFVLLLSAAGVSLALYYWLHEPLINCVVYAIPLSIMSGSIVIPSIHTLTENKKEFLVYEASFSDIMGILFFNYFVAGEVTSLISIGSFFLNIIIAIVLSLVFSILLLFILTRSKLNIKFFLVFPCSSYYTGVK